MENIKKNEDDIEKVSASFSESEEEVITGTKIKFLLKHNVRKMEQVDNMRLDLVLWEIARIIKENPYISEEDILNQSLNTDMRTLAANFNVEKNEILEYIRYMKNAFEKHPELKE